MPKAHQPRHGSMQFWPRKRANRIYPTPKVCAGNEPKLLGFAGYKVGMTHISVVDNRPKAPTKGQEIAMPVTIIECPPMKMASIRFCKNLAIGSRVITEIFTKGSKELGRKLILPKKSSPKNIDDIKSDSYDFIKIQVYTQPKKSGLGKKKPELFELAVGGSKEEALEYVKSIMDKEISVSDIFKEGQLLDAHAVTTGRGFQGPVKRFGVGLRNHKSEKVKRGPGSLGAWVAQAHTMHRIAHAGQTGFHTRTEFNKWLIKISNNPEEINVKGGFINYGNVKADYILVKGSIPGPKKRCIVLCNALRADKLCPKQAPRVEYISLESKQGN